ncbi:CRP-like cAMP-binding protein [Chryseobacterium defluvii]|uniref:CRP-like cAMP-binding protein n=1 Tax=Chryseobacterium defluvii TaxID=160396 RepID=A0A840KE78_9FLAO|nr:Crp/Fnr family transcriptional regulator [Chryseobacterium defluvii]MBB4805252.1 CRP-like cAMP-binding protein [Chryseobacterium defluvii]
MDVFQYFSSQVRLSDKETELLSHSVRRKKFQKKDLILPVENNSKNIYFIEEGIARVFYAQKDKDITLYFLSENNIGLPVDSIFYNQICKFGIESLTETTVAVIPYSSWEKLAEHNAGLQKFSQKLMVNYIKNATDRIYNLKFQTPKERFETLLSEFPSIFLKAPLGHIASYLGITQETLSRLRAGK